LGKINADNDIVLSNYGTIVKEKMESIDEFFPFSKVVKYVIMPNHIHMILRLSYEVYYPTDSNNRTNMTIPRIVSALKRFTNKEIGFNMWQRSYHDHIIRNEKEFTMICDYIQNNPANWSKDCFYTSDQ
jgi:Transposase and inactivated derivatives